MLTRLRFNATLPTWLLASALAFATGCGDDDKPSGRDAGTRTDQNPVDGADDDDDDDDDNSGPGGGGGDNSGSGSDDD